MGIDKDGGLVARAVREALGTLVAPQVSGQLVARALRSAGLAEIPEGGRAIADWIEGALRREVETAVGSDAADLLAAQLAPIVAHAVAAAGDAGAASGTGRGSSSAAHSARGSGAGWQPAAAHGGSSGGRPQAADRSAERAPGSARGEAEARAAFGSERPTGVAPAPQQTAAARAALARTARVRLTADQMQQLTGREAESEERHTSRPQSDHEQVPGSDRPRVLAACSDASAVTALQAHLLPTANVVQVNDLVELLDALDDGTLVKPIVLVDCQRPTVHVTSIAAISEDLPSGTTVVLWGASDAAWQELDRERVASCRWVRCSQEATTDDVGSLCAMLIG